MSNGKNGNTRNGKLRPRGSTAKKPSRTGSEDGGRAKTETPKPRKKQTWREAKVLYDRKGNIVVHDRLLAKRLRDRACGDRRVHVSLPVAPGKFQRSATPHPGTGIGPPPNNQCQCTELRVATLSTRVVVVDDPQPE